ncbi:MAG: hypothetical protein ACI4RA_05320 [Kiritimatiellia bacterium]
MIKDLKGIAAIVLLLTVGCTNSRQRISGVYSNGRSEFSASSVVLSHDGYCLFSGGVGGACGSWEVVSGKGCDFVHLRLADTFLHSEVREFSALLRLDAKKRQLQLVTITNAFDEAMSFYAEHGNSEPRNRDGLYRFVTNAIPEEISAMLAKFPGELERAKMRAEGFRRAKEAEAARLAAEQPRYDAFRAKVVADPSCVGTVELEFVKAGEGPEHSVGRARWTPECRALIDVLKDRSITFPEDALMKLVEKYPWESDFFIIGHAFSRDELSSDSRRKLHPRMRDFANRLNYELGGAFYEHPNTPVDLVQEAFAWERNCGGFADRLESRLKREGIVTPRERERLERVKQREERARREEEERKRRREAEEKRREEARRLEAERTERRKVWQERVRQEREERERKEQERLAAEKLEAEQICALAGTAAVFEQALSAYDKDKVIRGWIAEVKKRPVVTLPADNLLKLLAKAESSTNFWSKTLRFAILERPEIPVDVLEREYEDMASKRWSGVSHVMKNPNFSDEMLRRAYVDPRIEGFRYQVAINPAFPWQRKGDRDEFMSRAQQLIRDKCDGKMTDEQLSERLHGLMLEMQPKKMPSEWRGLL